MRVLFATWTGSSHLFPMVPLAWAAIASGHEVRMATPPSCTQSVLGAGLTAVPVGRDVSRAELARRTEGLSAWLGEKPPWPRDWARSPETLGGEVAAVYRTLAEKQFAVADVMIGDLLEFARSWRPDLIVHDTVCYAATVVGAVLGVPTVSHMFGSPMITRNELTDMTGAPLPGYAELFERFGAVAPDGPEAWVDPCPPLLRWPARVERTDIRFVPYNGTGGVEPEWMRERKQRARVCLTWGLTAAEVRPDSMPGPFEAALKALLDVDVDVVLAVTAAHRGLLGELPEQVRVVEGVPFSLLLRRCDALVHHGGTGTGLTAVAAGVPQLMFPLAPVLAAFAERVDAAGAGVMLDPGEVEGVEGALERVLGEGVRERTGEVRAHMAGVAAPGKVWGELAGLV
ncbi:nucleotide disphospho-sugar-binding domain-containing protein [Actinokineospora sp. NBRC 105648]|uniref:nucleotide disphospho-sugar-binding domain-containing protein n=1 Tax=Actinokineospora sp. NBRC 105648 TaxID=3032206 RepID=UPI0024A133CB|nr:nucleotide disphospho-sugar-binding domain-containing protein [Actinokineospora sp. NBRC 105648]GLZ36628.1 glycosyl transferase [Actinokineospora sp. NBRC 105648]